LTLTAAGTVLTLSGTNTFSGATTVGDGSTASTLTGGAANAFSAASALTVNAASTVDLGGFNQAIASLAGAGTVTNSGVASPATLAIGGGTATTFSGVIRDGTSATALTLSGTGTGLTLSNTDTYTGATMINGGTLDVSGSIATSSLTTVNSTGTLTGAGTVGATTVASGGTFAPGNGAPGSSMAVNGSLALQSGAIYMVQINPTTSSFASVTGGVSLSSRATVDASFASGTYVAKKYTILTATGTVSGTFNPTTVNTNLPSDFHTTLSYDTRDAYLNLALNFAILGGLNVNQQNVGNALTNFFNSTGSIPMVFGALTPAGLTQLSGEAATGSQQTTFDAMNMFIGTMLDPFNRGTTSAPGGGPNGYAAEGDASAYASSQNAGAARDAYAMFTKAPPPVALFEQRWSVWAAGFGGSQTTDGNAALGSNSTTSRVYGTAVGADYRISPFTVAGFALAGGGTNFSVEGSGGGHSDLFQAGAFVRHAVGAAYLSAALAYGWQDITTNRTVTVAGTDQLQAKFNANAFSGRLEGGYRLVAPWVGGVGITPYAAAQFTTFDLPAYAEQAIVGTNAFALANSAKDVTDTRSELGIRTDKSWAMTDGILTLRGRLAWAHDYDPNRSIAATFQTLPGASFVVNGAAQASDSALVTASIEKKWLSGWSAAATFEGEFSDVTRSYAGKGVVRYQW
jgi:autotransporter-associated beta strand protein